MWSISEKFSIPLRVNFEEARVHEDIVAFVTPEKVGIWKYRADTVSDIYFENTVLTTAFDSDSRLLVVLSDTELACVNVDEGKVIKRVQLPELCVAVEVVQGHAVLLRHSEFLLCRFAQILYSATWR